jgi:hypothetical protein
VQSERADVAAWELVVRAGRAWTVATAKMSAVAKVSATVTVRFIGVLADRFM